jgi:hypothetical protein
MRRRAAAASSWTWVKSDVTRALLVAVLIVSTVAVASADPAPAPAVPASPAGDAEAARLLEEGERLFATDADYPAALDRFRRSYDLEPSARALNGTVVAHQMLGRHVEAFEGLERLLTEFTSTLSEGQKARIQRRLEELRARIGVIEIRADQRDARVLVDGRELGRGPLRTQVRVAPGSHTVVVTLPGHDPATRAVVVAAGGTVTADVVLAPVPVRVERPVLVRRMEPWIPWVTLGAGAALVAGGVGFRVSADRDYDAAKLEADRLWSPDQRPVDITALDEYRSAQTKNGVAISLWAVGGAAVVTGAVLVIWNQPRAVEQKPVVLPTGNGAVLHVSF